MCTPRKSDRRASVDLSTLPDPLILRRAFFGGGKNPSLFPSSLPLHIEDSRANNEATCKGDRYVPPVDPTYYGWFISGLNQSFNSPDYTSFDLVGQNTITGYNETYTYSGMFGRTFNAVSGSLEIQYNSNPADGDYVRVYALTMPGAVIVYDSGALLSNGVLVVDLSTFATSSGCNRIDIVYESEGSPSLAFYQSSLSGFSFTLDP